MLSELCQNLDFTNFGAIGTCFIQNAFFGDIGLAGLMIAVVFVGFIVRYNMPGNMILPIASVLAYALMLASGGASIFYFIFIITLIVNGVLMVMAMLNIINR